MKMITTIAMVSMMAFSNASAGEWGGNGPGYQGTNKYQYGRGYRGHHNAPGVQYQRNIPVVRPPAYCFNCGTIANRRGQVLREVPPTHRRQQMNTDYRKFFGRAPVIRGIGTFGLIGTYQWYKGEIDRRDNFRDNGITFHHYE